MVCLKQDALYFSNLAIARCACGSLVDLFEAAYSYPKSAEAKCRAKEFKELECQLLDKDEEVRIIEPEQDLKEQEELLPHPFQKNPPVPTKPSTSRSLESEGKAPASKPESQGKKTLKRIIPAPTPSGNHKQEIAKKLHFLDDLSRSCEAG